MKHLDATKSIIEQTCTQLSNLNATNACDVEIARIVSHTLLGITVAIAAAWLVWKLCSLLAEILQTGKERQWQKEDIERNMTANIYGRILSSLEKEKSYETFYQKAEEYIRNIKQK